MFPFIVNRTINETLQAGAQKKARLPVDVYIFFHYFDYSIHNREILI